MAPSSFGDFLKLALTVAVAGGTGSAAVAKFIVRSEVAGVEAKIDAHLQPTVTHPATALRLEEQREQLVQAKKELRQEVQHVAEVAQVAADESRYTSVLLQASLRAQGISVPPRPKSTATAAAAEE